MEWSINPYDGVGNLKFGMSQRLVSELLGPAVKIIYPRDMPFLELEDYDGIYTHDEVRTFDGSDYEKSMPTVSYNEDSAISFVFSEVQESLNYRGIYFYRGIPRENILKLRDISRSVVRSHADYYTFVDLGIAVLDEDLFDFNDPVIVFSKGRYDRSILAGLKAGTSEFVKGGVQDLERVEI